MRSNPDFPALAAAAAPAASASRFTLTAGGRAFAQINRFHPELTAFRRDLHAHPELGFEEVYTSGRVAQALKLCGVDAVHRGIGVSLLGTYALSKRTNLYTGFLVTKVESANAAIETKASTFGLGVKHLF